MDREWRANFSAQYAATIAAAVTIGMFGFAGAIAFWIWKSADVSKPVFAFMAFVLLVALATFSAVASWWKREQQARRSAGEALEGEDAHHDEGVGLLREIERLQQANAVVTKERDDQIDYNARNASTLGDEQQARLSVEKELKKVKRDLERAQEQAYAQDLLLKAKDELLNPPPIPMAPELVGFVDAWLMPAWNRLMNLFGPMISATGTHSGGAQSALLEMAILDPAKDARVAVESRLMNTRIDDLNPLVAEMYRKYELVVRWVVQAERMANWRFDNDSRIGDWRTEDDKMMDNLRALAALPNFAKTSLGLTFKELAQSGTVDSFRKELKKRDAHFSDGS